MWRMLIAGDLFPRDASVDVFRAADPERLFDQETIGLFRRADYAVCNLEGVLTDNPLPIEKCGPVICAPLDTVGVYRALGIKAVTLANNHAMDGGVSGYHDTTACLDREGIAWLGAGPDRNQIRKYHVIQTPAGDVALYAVAERMFNAPSDERPGAHLYDELTAVEDLRNLKKQGTRVIVLYHGGQEYYPYPSPLLHKRMHLLAEAGADVILVQHSHQLVARENYRGTEILYGQGNSHFYSKRGDGAADVGVLAEVGATESGLTVAYHFIARKGLLVSRIDPPEDFAARSRAVEEGQEFPREFDAFARGKLVQMLSYYRGRRTLDRIMKKLLSPARYERYMLSRYTRYQLLRILNSYRCDEHREAVTAGLESELHA